MFAKLLAIITFIILLFSSSSSLSALSESNPHPTQLDELNLPSALTEDDSFNELPFEQLRQALREEVERDPTKKFKASTPDKYNLLIR